MVFRFPEAARGLNGSCPLASGILLVADCLQTPEPTGPLELIVAGDPFDETLIGPCSGA